jgi:hypothetical protein
MVAKGFTGKGSFSWGALQNLQARRAFTRQPKAFDCLTIFHCAYRTT